MAEPYADTAEAPLDPAPAVKAPKTAPAAKLLALLDTPNLVTTLTDEKLTEISDKVLRGYKLDDASREDWKERNRAGLKLATLIAEQKDYPFIGAANVKTPLIITAALQFNARAYPAIVMGERVAKSKVNGYDGPVVDPQTQKVIAPPGQKAKRAERVSEHMSWQLLTEMPEWEEDTDRLLLIVSIAGSIFRKRYWDPTLGRQCSRLVPAERLVINYKSRSLQDTPRITEELPLYPYEIEERIRDGRFVTFEYGQAVAIDDDDDGEMDEDSPHLFVEQHRLLDLDGDGYAEPYIVTVHVESQKVCRIVPNFDKDSVRVTADGKIAAIRKRDYFTKYMFFPSPDGGAYGMGFGSLLGSTTETINALVNEMVDAGHLANTQGGFIAAAAGIREKNYRFAKGEFKIVNTNMPLSQAILPIEFKGPSETLFKLLGLLMEFGSEVAGTKDVMTGDTGGKTMQPTTVLALIEQGMKVFNAIFKRIHRAVKNELELHAKLNYENLTAEAYNDFFDGPEQYDPKADYNLDDMNITPVSDPSVSTSMQKLAKAQVTREIAADHPWINHMEVDRRAFEAADVPDIDKLFVPPPKPDPKQQAFMEAMQKLTLQELLEKIHKSQTAQIKDIADAEAAEAGQQLSLYDQYLQMLQQGHDMEAADNAQVPGGPGGLPGMGGAPDNPMGAGALPAPGGDGGAGPAGPAPELDGGAQPAPMGGAAAPVSAPAGPM